MAVPDSDLHLERSRTSSSGNETRSISATTGNINGCNRVVFKRRKVSAVRTFPPGCGRFAVRITPGLTGSGIDVGGNKSEENTAVLADAGNHGAPEDFKSTPDLGQTDGVQIKVEIPGVFIREEQDAVAEELDSALPVKPEEPSKVIVVDGSLGMPDVDLSDAEKDITQAVALACPARNFLKKSKVYEYPPPRSVSAIREFPPFCGRNTPMLKEEPLSNYEASLLESKEIDAETSEDTLQERDGNALNAGGDEIQVEPRPLAVVLWKEEDEFERKMVGKDAVSDYIGSPPGSNQNLVSPTEKAPEEIVSSDLEEPTGKEIAVCKRKCFDQSRYEERSMEEDGELEDISVRPIVLGIMASPNSPWKSMDRGVEKKGKKQKWGSSSVSRKIKSEGEGSSVWAKGEGSILNQKTPDEGIGQMVVWEPEDSSELEEPTDDYYISVRPRNYSVSLPPIPHASFGGEVDGKTETVTRNKVRETLRLFQAVCRKLLQEEEARSKQENRRKRVDLQAAKILKEKGRYVNGGKPIIGNVPGVEVGDEFQYRVELNIIGLHRVLQAGIDYVNHGGEILATSVVSSGAYEDVLEHSDFLIYTGQGGNVVVKDKEPEDQKLERGNLALSNSVSAKNPVRVIRGLRESNKASILYTYDGLYLVDKCWQEDGQHGKLVYKFRLNRIPGQPELAWKTVKKSKRHEAREGLCVTDISQGKEMMPIGAVNTIDDEKPPEFNYITSMIYPDWCRRIPLVGCSCTDGCSDSEKCSCAVNNGGEIPYNYNGAIVEAKPLVYECGPSCKCPLSCHNRVCQRGIRFPLEIFKTESRGWGVRCLASIPSGSFICEYIGELLDDRQAEERAGSDEYLFDIGNYYNDNNMREELSCLIPDAHAASPDVIEELGFTIDAAIYGNVGRFINHSCSPNLYAQNVLYGHDDKRIPHIMFFAAENIPPLQELTYHYNYMIDQVHDADGNIKTKSCFCGSVECTGRMY